MLVFFAVTKLLLIAINVIIVESSYYGEKTVKLTQPTDKNAEMIEDNFMNKSLMLVPYPSSLSCDTYKNSEKLTYYTTMIFTRAWDSYALMRQIKLFLDKSAKLI